MGVHSAVVTGRKKINLGRQVEHRKISQIIKNTQIHPQNKRPTQCEAEHSARAWASLPSSKTTDREVRLSDRLATKDAQNRYKPLEVCQILEWLVQGHRELREATDAFDGRNNGVVSPGGDGSPGAPSSMSKEEAEKASLVGDGW